MAFEIVTTQPSNTRSLEAIVRILKSSFFLSKGVTLLLGLDKRPDLLIIKDTATAEYYIALAPVGSPNAYKLAQSSAKERLTLRLSNRTLNDEILKAYGITGDRAKLRVSNTPVVAMGLNAYLLIKT